jgi:hypothetical protein
MALPDGSEMAFKGDILDLDRKVAVSDVLGESAADSPVTLIITHALFNDYTTKVTSTNNRVYLDSKELNAASTVSSFISEHQVA